MRAPQTILRLRREAIFGDTINLYAASHLGGDRYGFPKPIEWEVTECPPWQIPSIQAPLLTLDPTQAQTLMDELWTLGIRPAEGHGSTGQLAATEKHLTHITQLLDQSFTTVMNVANATLLRDTGCQPVPAPATPKA